MAATRTPGITLGTDGPVLHRQALPRHSHRHARGPRHPGCGRATLQTEMQQVEHIGHLDPHQVHDATLAPLISERIADGVCAVTINRTLEVARTILPCGALVPRRRWPAMA